MIESEIQCPGVQFDSVGRRHEPIMNISDPVEEARYTHAAWREMLRRGMLRRAPLPAIFVRIPDFSEPAAILDQRGQAHVAAAAETPELSRPTPTEGAVEHRTPETFSQPSEADLLVRAELRKKFQEIDNQLKAMSPAQLNKFVTQYNSPLPVSGHLQPQNSQRK